jgi:hypothetical protein
MEYNIIHEYNDMTILVRAIHNKTNTCYEASIQNNDIYSYVLNNIKKIKITSFVIDDKLYLKCANICTIALNKKDNKINTQFIIHENKNDKDTRIIYIDGQQQYIKNILYSINTINNDSIVKLKEELDYIYHITNHIQNEINEKLNELEIIDFDMIHYNEPDESHNESKFSILLLFKKNQELNFNTIIKSIYSYELNNISLLLPNHTIIISNNMIHFNEANPISYLTKNTIISRLAKSIQNNPDKMEQLKKLILENIYKDYICKNNYNNISEIKLKKLYQCFDIKAIKLVVESKEINDKLLALNTICNVLIPMQFIDKTLYRIIENSTRVDDMVFIDCL